MADISSIKVGATTYTIKDATARNGLAGKLDSTANAVSATKATQDGNGNVIASTYKTKNESLNVVITSSRPTSPTAGTIYFY